MHQNVISAEQLADIQRDLTVFSFVNDGAIATTIGRHPSLGSCVVFDDTTQDVVLLSEVPFAATHVMPDSTVGQRPVRVA